MKRRTTSGAASVALALLTLVPGCGGGQTGDLSGKTDTPGGATSGAGCDDHATDIALDDASSLGFSAQAVLAFAAKGFDSGLVWQAIDGVHYAPGAGASTVALTLSSLGKAAFVHSTPQASSEQGGPAIAFNCAPDRLKVAVHAELATADGALQESFDAELEASDAALAQLNHQLDPATLQGTFAIGTLDPSVSTAGANTHLEHLTLASNLSPAGIAGQLTGNLVSIGAQVASSAGITFAHFPDDAACPTQPGFSPAIPVSADDLTIGLTGSDAIRDINARSPLALSWSGGQGTELTLELTDLQVGCLQPSSFIGTDQPSPTIIYPVTVHASTLDGKLNGSYAVSLVVERAVDGQGYVRELQYAQQFALADVGQTGFSNVPAIPAGAQRLGLGFRSLFTDTAENGSIVLNALTDPPCLTNPEPPMGNSAPGCSGTAVSELVKGSWGVQ